MTDQQSAGRLGYMTPEQAEELVRLRADLAWAEAERVLLFDAEKWVIALRRQYIAYWRNRDEHYWMERLMQEVGELASSLALDHDDPPDWELKQIAAICINWLEKRAALSPAAAPGDETEMR